MHTRTPTTVVVPRPRRAPEGRIALGIPIPVRVGALKDCAVVVHVDALGPQQKREGQPFVVTITPLPGWSPPTKPCGITFDGTRPVQVYASADEVEDMLAEEGITWR